MKAILWLAVGYLFYKTDATTVWWVGYWVLFVLTCIAHAWKARGER